jgi:signal transduction histidine kinase
MSKPFKISLQWQILATALLVLVTGAGLYMQITDNLILASMDRQLSQRLNVVGQLFERKLPWQQYSVYLPGDQVTQSYLHDFQALQEFNAEFGLARTSVIGPTGRITLDSGELKPGDWFEKKGINSQIRETLLHRDTRQHWNKTYYFPLPDETCLRFEAGTEMLNPMNTIQTRRWLALGMGICLAFLLSWFLSRWLGQRLSRLSAGFLRLQNGDPAVQIPVSGQDEIAFVSRGFNIMSSELEKRQQRERNEHERRISELRILAGGVAHEIRNPLGAIAGLSDLLARQPELKQNPDSQELLTRLRSEIQRMDQMVQDILAYARQPQMNLTCLPAAAFLREMQHLDAALQFEIPTPLPDLLIDAAGMRTALRNLIINARQAAGPDGIVRLGIRSKPGRMLLYIADDGPGIPEPILPNIFQPFFTQKPKGAGLGLAIARNIVEAHGGQLRVAPAKQGAVLVIYLPVSGGG